MRGVEKVAWTGWGRVSEQKHEQEEQEEGLQEQG